MWVDLVPPGLIMHLYKNTGREVTSCFLCRSLARSWGRSFAGLVARAAGRGCGATRVRCGRYSTC